MLCKFQQTTSIHAVHLWILCVHSLFCLHLESHIDNLTQRIKCLEVRNPHKKGVAVSPFFPVFSSLSFFLCLLLPLSFPLFSFLSGTTSTMNLIITHKQLFCIFTWLFICTKTMGLNGFHVQIFTWKTLLSIKVISYVPYIRLKIFLRFSLRIIKKQIL